MPPSDRLFVALFPPVEIQEELGEKIREWRKRLPKDGVRWVRPEKLHVTLCFLGSVASEHRMELESRLGLIDLRSPFRLTIKGLGALPSSRRPRVLWAGFEGDLESLHSLAEVVGQASQPFLEKPEDRSFSPHLTLARFTRPHSLENLIVENADTRFGTWSIESFVLVRSGIGEPGSPYCILREFPL